MPIWHSAETWRGENHSVRALVRRKAKRNCLRLTNPLSILLPSKLSSNNNARDIFYQSLFAHLLSARKSLLSLCREHFHSAVDISRNHINLANIFFCVLRSSSNYQLKNVMFNLWKETNKFSIIRLFPNKTALKLWAWGDALAEWRAKRLGTKEGEKKRERKKLVGMQQMSFLMCECQQKNL